MEKIKFTRLYDVDGYVSGYKCGKYYIMKHYVFGNNYEWIINEDGESFFFNSEFTELIESGKIILCESLKSAKEKVKEMIKKDNKKLYVKRGEIYYIDLGQGIGSEQEGDRPCVIIQNDKGNKYSTTTIVAPITKHKKNLITHQTIKLHNVSYIMYEQIRVVDKARIINKIGELNERQLSIMDKKIKISLGLKEF